MMRGDPNRGFCETWNSCGSIEGGERKDQISKSTSSQVTLNGIGENKRELCLCKCTGHGERTSIFTRLACEKRNQNETPSPLAAGAEPGIEHTLAFHCVKERYRAESHNFFISFESTISRAWWHSSVSFGEVRLFIATVSNRSSSTPTPLSISICLSHSSLHSTWKIEFTLLGVNQGYVKIRLIQVEIHHIEQQTARSACRLLLILLLLCSFMTADMALELVWGQLRAPVRSHRQSLADDQVDRLSFYRLRVFHFSHHLIHPFPMDSPPDHLYLHRRLLNPCHRNTSAWTHQLHPYEWYPWGSSMKQCFSLHSECSSLWFSPRSSIQCLLLSLVNLWQCCSIFNFTRCSACSWLVLLCVCSLRSFLVSHIRQAQLRLNIYCFHPSFLHKRHRQLQGLDCVLESAIHLEKSTCSHDDLASLSKSYFIAKGRIWTSHLSWISIAMSCSQLLGKSTRVLSSEKWTRNMRRPTTVRVSFYL